MKSVLLSLLLLAGAPPPDDFGAVREEFLAGINTERARNGAPPVSLSPPLTRVAQDLADAAAQRGDKDLRPPPEKELVGRVESAGYSVKALAEVFTLADGSVAEVIAYWKSRGGSTWAHLLRADFRDLGVGVAMLDDVPLYVFLLGVTWDEYAAGRAREYGDPADMRRRMLDRVNGERRRQGLPSLAPSGALDRVAQAHAEDMLERSYYGHKSPDGLTVRERALRGGYRLRFVGENIASGQSTVDEVMDGWMASDEHRPNILSKVYTEAGFGLAIGKNKGGVQIIWVQVFGRPRLKFG
jgi:uncharacterized protein YkwD